MSSTLAIRAVPDRAPNGASRLLHALSTLLASCAVLCFTPGMIVRFVLSGPPSYSLKHFLLLRFTRYLSILQPLLPPAENNKERWAIPKTLGLGSSTVKIETVTIPPAPEEDRVAYATIPPKSSVKPEIMPGYILTPEGALGSGTQTAQKGEKLFVYIHGGGYISGHPAWTAFPMKIAHDTRTRVYCVQYRKCLSASTAFPGPLLDALAAWTYVTKDLGFDPSQIVLGGDSAGGHLSLSLTQQLHALDRPIPAGLALLSPWVDFTFSFPSWSAHSMDFITTNRLGKAVRSATRYYEPEAVRGPFFSPALAPAGHWSFLEKSGTRVFVTFGSLEALTGEDEAFIAGMKQDGVDVSVYEDKYGVHNTPVLDAIVGETRGALTATREGIQELFDGMEEVSEGKAGES